jgi:hypothetical protein
LGYPHYARKLTFPLDQFLGRRSVFMSFNAVVPQIPVDKEREEIKGGFYPG